MKHYIDKKHYTEAEMKAYALEQSESMMVRAMNNGNSCDYLQETTHEQGNIIYAAIYGALLSICSGEEMHSAQSTAESIADLMLPGMNGYDTIFCRIEKFFSA